MLIKNQFGDDNIATVYIAQIKDKLFEFAESIQPPLTRNDKWVLTLSCLYGCPVKCLMCDAGRQYKGCMSKEDILKQINYLITKRFPNKIVPCEKFKIQFSRMGEPAFNNNILEVLKELPKMFHAPGLIPSISTIGPKNANSQYFFKELTKIKNNLYPNGKFQMQFSIHTTDINKRDKLIPTAKMSFQEIANFADKFHQKNDRKITLNFIVMQNYPIEAKIIKKFFNKDKFIIKLTPLNPTNYAKQNKLETKLEPIKLGEVQTKSQEVCEKRANSREFCDERTKQRELCSNLVPSKLQSSRTKNNKNNHNSIKSLTNELKNQGFQVIISIGEPKENEIKSNCGQYISV